MKKETAKKEIETLIARYPCLAPMREQLCRCVDMLAASCQSGGKLLVCGNGGSAADSLHIVGELMKGFVLNRKIPSDVQSALIKQYPSEAPYYIQNLQAAVPAISLVSETALMTAFGNDQAADLSMAQQMLGYGCPGDVLLAISTSGNSANIVHAARIARVLSVKVVALTGQGGGELAALADILLDVPSGVTYQIQELHLPVYHALCLAVERELFDEQEVS